MNQIGLADGFSAQILPFLGEPAYVFLLYQFFSQMPRDLYDAVVVDGASPSEIQLLMVLADQPAGAATVAILLGIETGTSISGRCSSPSRTHARPISVGIAGFFGADSITYWNPRCRRRW